VVEGKGHSEIVRIAFWSRVAFDNYIQEIVSDSLGVAPSEEMWKRAEEPFFEVLDHLKSTYILILSKRLWENMGSRGKYGKMISVNGYTRDTWIYDYQGGAAYATWIRHPTYWLIA